MLRGTVYRGGVEISAGLNKAVVWPPREERSVPPPAGHHAATATAAQIIQFRRGDVRNTANFVFEPLADAARRLTLSPHASNYGAENQFTVIYKA